MELDGENRVMSNGWFHSCCGRRSMDYL